MEERINSLAPSEMRRGGGKPIALIARLMQQVANMQHVDEVFLWLAQAMVQSLNIAVVQFLAIQQDNAGAFHAEVRAIASQNPSPAQARYVNNQITVVAERIFRDQQGITSRPVEIIFPPMTASLLAQHDLRCWAGYFLQNEAFLPPVRSERAPMSLPVPLKMVVSLFTLYPLSTEQARAVHFILEQSMRIIVSKGFLALRATPAAPKDPAEDMLLAYGHIIPQRAENIEQFLANNPFSSASIIADKNARRLYTAIDGEKNLAELIRAAGLGPQEMLVSLLYLFKQQRIRFYTITGELIENLNLTAATKI